jgi:predicted NACHT family NTPase
MAGEDIEVTKLSNVFLVDQKSGVNLITRRLSRGVVADCFKLSESCSNYAIVGSPGIGKSWTLLYALQQALLSNNACVVIWFPKEGVANTCI